MESDLGTVFISLGIKEWWRVGKAAAGLLRCVGVTELCPAQCGLEDQCEDVLREAGAIPEPPEFGTGLKSDQVCSEIKKTKQPL